MLLTRTGVRLDDHRRVKIAPRDKTSWILFFKETKILCRGVSIFSIRGKIFGKFNFVTVKWRLLNPRDHTISGNFFFLLGKTYKDWTHSIVGSCNFFFSF